MREAFFSKIGCTRSFISGPADPMHNPYMVCAMSARKIFYQIQGQNGDTEASSQREASQERPEMAI